MDVSMNMDAMSLEAMDCLMSQNPNQPLLDDIEKRVIAESTSLMELLERGQKWATENSKGDQKANEDPTEKLQMGSVPRSAIKRNHTNIQEQSTVVKTNAPRSQLKKFQNTVLKAGGPLKKRTASEVVGIDQSADKSAMNKVPKGKIQIEVQGGPHAGMMVLVEPLTKNSSKRQHVYVGRSAGKEYREFGLSLVKDVEVSTKHGVIHRIKDTFCFKDTNSSNGTRLVEHTDEDDGRESFTPLEYYPLANGTRLRIGACVLKFNF